MKINNVITICLSIDFKTNTVHNYNFSEIHYQLPAHFK